MPHKYTILAFKAYFKLKTFRSQHAPLLVVNANILKRDLLMLAHHSVLNESRSI